MPLAYVMINVEPGTEDEVLSEMINIEGVKEAHIVFGIYDIIAKIEVESTDKLRELIVFHIRKLKVRGTQTVIVAAGPKKL